MTEILVSKAQGGFLIPIDDASQQYIAKLKLGQPLRVQVTRMNNAKFHRKLMALFNLGFEMWEPEQDGCAKEYKGQKVEKNFDRFRGDITVLAGYFHASYKVTGETVLTPKSISFNNMDHDEREALFNSVINVLLKYVMKNYTREDLDNAVERILRFE